MLRIDESSKTLVAPESTEFVPDAPPARDELLALISSGWDAFAAEINQPRLKAIGAAPEPGIDLLAVDVEAGRATVVIFGEGAGKSSMGRALAAASAVATWDVDRMGALHELLQGVTPGDTPKMLIIGPAFDEDATRLADLLTRHGMDIAAYSIEVMRRGEERMMTAKPTYPAPPAPPIVASVDATNSAPPPPPTPAPQAA